MKHKSKKYPLSSAYRPSLREFIIRKFKSIFRTNSDSFENEN